MKCIVRKLKATIDNANLPVFENVVLKSYLTTTQDDQYMFLQDIIVPQSNMKLDVEYQTTSIQSDLSLVVASHSANTYVHQRNKYCRIYNTAVGDNVTVTTDTKISAGFDSSNGAYYVNETTGTCENPIQNQYTSAPYVFARYGNYEGCSEAGVIKIMKITVTNKTTNDVYVLVPAEINGVACLYDADRGKTYGEANGGTLVCG